MPTTLSKPSRHPAEPPDLPVVKYPDAFMEELRKISEITKLQMATGEIQPMTVEELAAELGIDLDD